MTCSNTILVGLIFLLLRHYRYICREVINHPLHIHCCKYPSWDHLTPLSLFHGSFSFLRSHHQINHPTTISLSNSFILHFILNLTTTTEILTCTITYYLLLRLELEISTSTSFWFVFFFRDINNTFFCKPMNASSFASACSAFNLFLIQSRSSWVSADALQWHPTRIKVNLN